MDMREKIIEKGRIEKDQSMIGLRGWIRIIGLGIVIVPIAVVVAAGVAIYSLASRHGWLTSQFVSALATYKSLWFIAPAVVIASGFLAYLFFQKKRAFPRWFMAMSVVPLLSSIAFIVTTKIAIPDKQISFERMLELLALVIPLAILPIAIVSAMLLSKRVKATFVR